ncbi:MAG: ABC transporter permease, partial [Gammaproteobacteria bacterium]|nr:ABC transporter permease [Gammaproteobacteria bacterium]
MNIFSFILKSLFRHKLRVTLTIFSLTTAFVLFILLRSVAVVFEAGWSGLDESRMQTTSKYSMIQMLPLSYGSQIASTDG